MLPFLAALLPAASAAAPALASVPALASAAPALSSSGALSAIPSVGGTFNFSGLGQGALPASMPSPGGTFDMMAPGNAALPGKSGGFGDAIKGMLKPNAEAAAMGREMASSADRLPQQMDLGGPSRSPYQAPRRPQRDYFLNPVKIGGRF